MSSPKFEEIIQKNCDVSDAKDNGIYSICTLVLKLRNLYKWENSVEPWHEPDSSILLDWIESKEDYWQTINSLEYQNLPINGSFSSPWNITEVNNALAGTNLIYGAGYGRSMKAIFFLGEKINEYVVDQVPVTIIGKEQVRELSSPFAMLQDGRIYIRRDQLRFFFWDQIQEIRSSCKSSLHFALSSYNILKNGKVEQELFKEQLDAITDNELDFFVYHELGELRQDTFSSDNSKKIISTFPNTPIEFVCRALKDILADIHPKGTLNYIIEGENNSSLGFYVGFLDGVRRILFPEIIDVFSKFLNTGDWQLIKNAVSKCQERNYLRAEKMRMFADLLDQESKETIRKRLELEILLPLGLDTPGYSAS